MTNYRRGHQELARHAQDLARRAGHALGVWAWSRAPGRVLGRAQCATCGRHAHIDTRPDPHQPELYGGAVAFQCWEETT
jgi:hypothetical protein